MNAFVFLHEQFFGNCHAPVAQMGEQGVDPVDVFTMGFDLFENAGGDKGLKRRLVFCFPEVQDRLHEPDDAVGTLHMALFPQKMDEYVAAVGDFIQPGGDITEGPFCTDVVKIGRKEAGQLFG